MGKKNHFKFKALMILLSSCHFIAHHCQSLSLSGPSPTQHVSLTKAPQAASAWLWVPHGVSCKGEGTAVRWHLEARPMLILGFGDPTLAPMCPCWDSTL